MPAIWTAASQSRQCCPVYGGERAEFKGVQDAESSSSSSMFVRADGRIQLKVGGMSIVDFGLWWSHRMLGIWRLYWLLSGCCAHQRTWNKYSFGSDALLAAAPALPCRRARETHQIPTASLLPGALSARCRRQIAWSADANLAVEWGTRAASERRTAGVGWPLESSTTSAPPRRLFYAFCASSSTVRAGAVLPARQPNPRAPCRGIRPPEHRNT